MTTVAWDLTTLAADSRCTLGDQILDEKCKKIHRNVGPFAAVSFCGALDEAELFTEALDEWTLDNVITMPPGTLEETSIIGVTKEGECYVMNPRGTCRFTVPWAWGSGGDFAIASMDHGCNAEQAVKYASTRDMSTNSKIQKYKVAK